MKASRLKNKKLPGHPLLTYYSLITDKNPEAAVRHAVLIIFIPFFLLLSLSLKESANCCHQRWMEDRQTDKQTDRQLT